MIRVLLVVLAILVAVLAFVLDKGWLYAASGAALAAALGWLAFRGWVTYVRTRDSDARKEGRREERLEDVGIVSVRPQEGKKEEGASGGAKSASGKDASGGRSGRSRPQPSRPTDTPRKVDEAPRASSTSTATGASSSTPSGAKSSASKSSASKSSASKSSAPTSSAAQGDAADSSSDARASGTSDPSKSRTSTEDETKDSNDTSQRGPSQGDGSSTKTRAASSQNETSDASAGASADVSASAKASGTTANGVTTTGRDAEPVLAPFVESLRAALGAHTVCLLVQEDVVLEYRIRAIASRSADVQRSGVFSTGDPLLTASMSRQPISVRRIDGGRDVVAGYLRYYDDPPEIDHIALAPIPLRDDPSTTFLLVDATEEGDLGAPHARTLIEHFAQTLAVMLQERASTPSESSETLPGDGGPTTTQTPRVRESDPVEAHEPAEAAEGPRPRREIIAEEIERADDTGGDLALVLVHLNRAEAIERGGAAAVESAEHALRRRLEEAAPDQRVERFGELTYGVFYRAGINEVETWAADLHDAMKAATGELEGGASIGAALLADRHQSPDDLREDATRALREAYETGACTIVE